MCYDASVCSFHASSFQESDERHCYIHTRLFYAFSYMKVGSSAKNGEREASGKEWKNFRFLSSPSLKKETFCRNKYNTLYVRSSSSFQQAYIFNKLFFFVRWKYFEITEPQIRLPVIALISRTQLFQFSLTFLQSANFRWLINFLTLKEFLPDHFLTYGKLRTPENN